MFIRFAKERTMRIVFTVTFIFFLFTGLSTNAGNNMKAFPPPDNGQLRFVLQLPEKDDESICKVELIIGKTIQLDQTNQYFFGGKILKETIAGWGFSRYIVKDLGPMAGILMAVDPNAPKVERFIRLGFDLF